MGFDLKRNETVKADGAELKVSEGYLKADMSSILCLGKLNPKVKVRRKNSWQIDTLQLV